VATDIVTITHSNEGIRVAWPNGTVAVFANPVYLAEAYARAVRGAAQARDIIQGEAAKHVNALRADINKEAEPSDAMAVSANNLCAALMDAAGCLVTD